MASGPQPRARRPGGGRREPERALLGLEEIAGRLADALARSTADETELAWIESDRDGAATRSLSEPEPESGRTVLVRVREGRRRGSFRTGGGEAAEIADAVRQAVAAARVRAPEEPPAGPAEPPPEAPRPGEAAAALWDEELAALDPAGARRLLVAETGARERASLEWTRTRVVVLTSGGVDRRAEATSVTARVVTGEGRRTGPSSDRGAGRAAASARSLAGLGLASLVLRARRRGVESFTEEAPPGGPILFSQEAACSLVSLLADAVLSAGAFADDGAPLAGALGEQVFSPAVGLVDDGIDPAGLPFPFDLLGRPRRRIPLVEAGVLRTPAVDGALSARLRLPVTGHAVGPDEARPAHLFLLPGASEEEVLAAAEGGVWIAALEGLECFDRRRAAARARAVGARRIVAGRFAEGLPDLVWEDSLLRLFSRVLALGGEPVRLAEPAFLGGTSAPMLVVDGAEALRIAR